MGNSRNFGNTIVTNLRHYQSLVETKDSLEAAIKGLDEGLTNDLLAEDIRQALFHLGEITGEITTEDLLENIFRKFCPPAVTHRLCHNFFFKKALDLS